MQINLNDISNIEYDEKQILNNDFDIIKEKINNLTFYNLYNLKISGKTFIINTYNDTYNFIILDNYIIYVVGENKYYAKSEGINIFLNNIIN